MSTYTCPHCGERGLSTQRRHWCQKAPPISQLLRLGPPRSRDPMANEYIARLTRELEEARELLRQIAADRCRCLHPFDICGNCRARRALVADLSSGRYAARDDVADQI